MSTDFNWYPTCVNDKHKMPSKVQLHLEFCCFTLFLVVDVMPGTRISWSIPIVIEFGIFFDRRSECTS